MYFTLFSVILLWRRHERIHVNLWLVRLRETKTRILCLVFFLPLSHLIQTQNKNKFRSTKRASLRERVNEKEREKDGETIVVIQYMFVHLK